MKHITQLFTLLLLLLAGQALAQVDVRLDPVRRDFLLGESVGLKITLVNHTDQTIKFTNSPGRSWLNFTVSSRDLGNSLTPKATPRYPDLVLSPGATRSYQVDIKPFYSLNRSGTYTVVATVRLPDMRTTYSSNRATFTLASGGSIKTFKTQARGQRLEMSVKILNVGGKDSLFGQVLNADSKVPIGACYLAQFLNFMEPRIVLDNAQNLHLLCQSTPEYFTYSIMNTKGGRSQYKLFRRSGGPVDLISTGKGIRTIGLVPYAPTKKGDEQYHSASDRPSL
ncbi:MAG: hypothetical protein IKV82_03270 [Akkermansia sp.]|nr:hypothetical protein [Akkermansia sp.]